MSMMKRTVVALLLASVLLAQAPSSVSVTVKTGIVQKIWQFILGSPTTITSFTCTQPADAQSPAAGSTVLMPGDVSTCTVTIVPGAGIIPGPVQISAIAQAPLVVGPDPNAAPGVTFTGQFLSIPSGATVGSFQVSYPLAGGVAALPVIPAAYWAWTDGSAGTPWYSADLMIPCCARADLCGYSVAEVAPEPCQTQ
jgi:hypothetical protein